MHRLGAGRFGVHEPLGSCTARRGKGHDHGQWGNAGGRLEPLLDRVHTTALATTSSTSVNRSCRSPSRCRSGLNRRPRPPRLCELLDRMLAVVLPVHRPGRRPGGHPALVRPALARRDHLRGSPPPSRPDAQRQWSDLAILRTTPALLGLFSLVTLWAARLEAERGISPSGPAGTRNARPRSATPSPWSGANYGWRRLSRPRRITETS